MDKEDVTYIYTMKYYSAKKKNEILPFAATWMDLEVIMLSEISQMQKDKYHIIFHIWNKKKVIDTENRGEGGSEVGQIGERA